VIRKAQVILVPIGAAPHVCNFPVTLGDALCTLGSIASDCQETWTGFWNGTRICARLLTGDNLEGPDAIADFNCFRARDMHIYFAVAESPHLKFRFCVKSWSVAVVTPTLRFERDHVAIVITRLRGDIDDRTQTTGTGATA